MIYLIGLPGVGKYTIAQEIARRSDFILVDNHLINNPVFTLIKADGKTPLPEEVWLYTQRIRDILWDAIENLAPSDHNFIFTNALRNDEQDRKIYDGVEALAVRRGSMFVPVLLTCAIKEHKRRVVTLGRIKRMKDVDPQTPERSHREGGLIRLAHPRLLQLDVTRVTPAKAAATVLRHAAAKPS